MRTCAVILSVSLAGTVAADPNVTFSFASDTAGGGPVPNTFRGEAGNGIVNTFRVPTGLLADDVNGPLPTLNFSTARFYADFDFSLDSTAVLGSGQVLRIYSLDGTFSFDNGSLMSVQLENAVFTVLGDANSWGSAGSIQASSIAGSTVTYSWNGPSQPAYNLFDGAVTQSMTDAAFTLTNITSFSANGTIQGVDVDPQTGLPISKWQSEGSYSGSAFFVPAPASAALISLAGLTLARRRR
jgi:hypothetical protein